jgi:TRAP-type C4-dicarboxylate transport system substrate-binding protein
MSMKETEEQTKALSDNGMTVVEPSEELMSGLRKIGEQMQEKWNETASDDAKQVVAAYKK